VVDANHNSKIDGAGADAHRAVGNSVAGRVGGGHHGRVTATRIRLAVPVAAGISAARQHTGLLGTAVTVQPS
jgi:hypothetical protein